jgi:hypothetical protein
MKKVLSPSEVAHVFANQLQSEARTQTNNFYFYDKNIYSYGSHFCIAKFVDNETLLFTESGYSNTTAKHINHVRHATSHIKKIYCYNPTGSHEQNFNHWLSEAENNIDKLKNARKPENYILELQRIKDKAEKYANYFGISTPITLENALSITDKAEIIAYLENKAEVLAKEKKRKETELKKEHAKNLKKWKNHEIYSLYQRDGFDYLRKDSENFQTSQGVKIPIAVGLRFYNSIVNKTIKAGDKFLDYTISEINNKLIKIGCHTITLKEINTIVNQ